MGPFSSDVSALLLRFVHLFFVLFYVLETRALSPAMDSQQSTAVKEILCHCCYFGGIFSSSCFVYICMRLHHHGVCCATLDHAVCYILLCIVIGLGMQKIRNVIPPLAKLLSCTPMASAVFDLSYKAICLFGFVFFSCSITVPLDHKAMLILRVVVFIDFSFSNFMALGIIRLSGCAGISIQYTLMMWSTCRALEWFSYLLLLWTCFHLVMNH